MIEKLKLENFQSHESTELEFVPGLNVIVGPSDQGKSAVLRSLYWVVQNKPDGLGFVSHWNITDKGTVKQPTQVTVVVDGKTVTRLRHKEVNRYLVGERKFDAFGRDVPEEVQEALKITEVNIQRQLDPHFLLSDSAGEVARIFNRTIRLDDIDKLLALVESKKRATRNALESTTEELGKTKQEVESLAWVDDVDVLVQKALTLRAGVEELKTAQSVIGETVDQFKGAQEVYDSIDTSGAQMLVEEIEVLLARQDRTVQLFKSFSSSVEDFIRICTEYESLKAVPDVTDMIEKVQEKSAQIVALGKEGTQIRTTILNFTLAQKEIEEIDIQLKDLCKTLPDLCPMCDGTGRLKEK